LQLFGLHVTVDTEVVVEVNRVQLVAQYLADMRKTALDVVGLMQYGTTDSFFSQFELTRWNAESMDSLNHSNQLGDLNG
jgi:hypothetical protein